MKRDKKRTVEESAKTKKTREKLKKRLSALEEKVTPLALEQKLAEIHRWISLNAVHRVILPTKTIALFDNNQNTAAVSRKVHMLLDQLKGKGAGLEQDPEKLLQHLRDVAQESALASE